MNSNKTDEMKPELIPLYTETDERAGTLIRYPDGSVKFSQDIKADRNVKDRLFRFIFGNPEHKKWTLALYNSVEHRNYTMSVYWWIHSIWISLNTSRHRIRIFRSAFCSITERRWKDISVSTG